MAEKVVDGNLKEGKKPDEMNSKELEDFISLQSTVIPVDAQGKEIVKDEPMKDDRPKEKNEKTGKEEKSKEIKEVKEIKEELILGKFKTQDEFIKAYQEAEKKISQQGEETSRTRRQAEDYQRLLSQSYDLDQYGQVIGPKVIQPKNDPLAQLRARYPGWEDEQLIPILEIAGAISNQAINNFYERQKKELEPLYEIKFEKDVEKQRRVIKDKYPDFADFENEVTEKLSNLPPSLRAKEGSVETIFLTVRGEHTPELLEKARRGAQKEVETIESRKEEAFVEGGGKSSVPTPPMDLEKMSSADLEKLIKEQQRKK